MIDAQRALLFLYSIGLGVCAECRQIVCPEHDQAVLVNDGNGEPKLFHVEHADDEARRQFQQEQVRVAAPWN